MCAAVQQAGHLRVSFNRHGGHHGIHGHVGEDNAHLCHQGAHPVRAQQSVVFGRDACGKEFVGKWMWCEIVAHDD